MTPLRLFIACLLTLMLPGMAGAATTGAKVPVAERVQGFDWSERPDDSFEIAQADCSGAAAQAAAQTGGQVLSVSSREEGGQTVCVVTVLIPGTDGGRPRKETVTIRP
ncbi:hypothetical protein [Aurantimonas sp. HBX-1]|uniref:hypothetical protein n=1 Tax=Aurantimonas sp. HBX-1 TaxID=2906072 RepID=UPI001F37AAF4|nr:hypothetical protein [Aurantimonas sp. HBX-1]UIJ74295.1 hypothetical protein LXB15_12785 [Aurantimonas sp. HBX-1]